MENTKNLKLPLLVPNQSQKEITHNEALVIIDNLLNNGVINKDLTIPPENPAQNSLYIVAKNAIDVWMGKDNQLAYFDNGWHFFEPSAGTMYWVSNKNCLYIFDGVDWINYSNSSVQIFGINTIADNANRLSVKSDNVLFDKNVDDSRVKVNKAAEENTASHLFQSNYIGKAEFGLISENNFSLKVSDDGDVWIESFKVENTTGDIDFKKSITNKGKNLSSLSMPGTNSINISPEDSGSIYVAPGDGYLMAFFHSTDKSQSVELNNFDKYYAKSISTEDDQFVGCTIMCASGDPIAYSYTTNLGGFIFIYAGEI